nr:MAG: hypothetical protein BECKSD772D_GA0070982_10111 [Candidatus Kentron sp. SD]
MKTSVIDIDSIDDFLDGFPTVSREQTIELDFLSFCAAKTITEQNDDITREDRGPHRKTS